MGQYYYPVIKIGRKTEVMNRRVDGEYTMAKLMEHSWWLNPFMKAMGNKLYKQKGQLIWLGDYAEQEDFDERGIKKSVRRLLDNEGIGIASVEEFSFDNKYICNHTKKEYLDLNKFYKNGISKDGAWCICPLSLLTAIGNGRGGGDYGGINADKVGIWAWDIISIEDEKPKDYTEFDIIFKEEF